MAGRGPGHLGLAPLSGTGPDQFRGRQPLNDWISGIHALRPDLSFVLDVGPIADEQYLVVRWKARGTYRGGFPGASPDAVGREVNLHRHRHPAHRRRQVRRVLG